MTMKSVDEDIKKVFYIIKYFHIHEKFYKKMLDKNQKNSIMESSNERGESDENKENLLRC